MFVVENGMAFLILYIGLPIMFQPALSKIPCPRVNVKSQLHSFNIYFIKGAFVTELVSAYFDSASRAFIYELKST